MLLPLLVGAAIALAPAPAGLPQYAWYYFAIFATVITGLVVEPIPAAAVGLCGVAVAAALARFVLFAPAQVAKPDFNLTGAAVNWALSGFANSTVWLIFAAFIFSLGYEKTGLGRRISLLLVSWLGGRTLSLGYAVALSDAVLAPFTPSNTARSGGTVFPVIKQIPAIYNSLPNDPSSRRIGSYLMWTALATTCVTSSMFLTGVAPNLLALALIRTTLHIQVTWSGWFLGFLPVGVILLFATPWLVYKLYPPELKESPEVPAWARAELHKLGKMSRREMVLAGLVLCALAMWVFGGSVVDATTAAMLVVVRPGGDPHRDLGRPAGQQAGLEHADLVRHAGDPGERAGAGGHGEVAGRIAQRLPGALVGGAGPDRAGRGVLPAALPVRQPDRAYHGAAADHAGDRRGDPRHERAGGRAGPEHDHRHHGHHHAVRHRPGTDLRGQRLPAAEGLLAAWHDLWRDQPGGLPRRWRPLVALDRVRQDQR